MQNCHINYLVFSGKKSLCMHLTLWLAWPPGIKMNISQNLKGVKSGMYMIWLVYPLDPRSAKGRLAIKKGQTVFNFYRKNKRLLMGRKESNQTKQTKWCLPPLPPPPFHSSLRIIPFPANHNFCHLLSHLLMFLGSLYCKQYGPRSDS